MNKTVERYEVDSIQTSIFMRFLSTGDRTTDSGDEGSSELMELHPADDLVPSLLPSQPQIASDEVTCLNIDMTSRADVELIQLFDVTQV